MIKQNNAFKNANLGMLLLNQHDGVVVGANVVICGVDIHHDADYAIQTVNCKCNMGSLYKALTPVFRDVDFFHCNIETGSWSVFDGNPIRKIVQKA